VQGTGTQPRRSYIRVHSGNNFSVRTDIDLWTSPTGKMLYTHQGLAVDRTGDTVAVQFSSSAATGTPDAGEVRVYKRGANGYSRVATLTPGAWRASAFKYVYGNALALSGDGQTLAVGDHEDNGTGLGPRAAPLVSGADTTGAVYVYRLVGTWKLANMVKPNYPPPALHGDWFGTGVALSQTGKTLIAPTYGESSSASGIDGDWANWDLPSSGAIFMY
jgi:hypothetical protein